MLLSIRGGMVYNTQSLVSAKSTKRNTWGRKRKKQKKKHVCDVNDYTPKAVQTGRGMRRTAFIFRFSAATRVFACGVHVLARRCKGRH